jgi:hypothetical protein
VSINLSNDVRFSFDQYEVKDNRQSPTSPGADEQVDLSKMIPRSASSLVLVLIERREVKHSKVAGRKADPHT